MIAGAAAIHNYPKDIIKVPNNAISYLFPAKYLIQAPKQFKNELIYRLVDNLHIVKEYIAGILKIKYDKGQILLCHNIKISDT